MPTLLQIDASARGSGSHTRRLSRLFIEEWTRLRPEDLIVVRDISRAPPSPVSEAWVAAAFTKPERRTEAMRAALAESDMLVAELERADLIVVGAPMYNFGVPSSLKAYIDNIVRVGRTFGFDRSREDNPYTPMLHGKRLVIVSARGDYGYGAGERFGHLNFVEPYLKTVFGFIGIADARTIEVEYDEFGDERLAASVAKAEDEVKRLVRAMTDGSAAEDARAA